VGLVLPSGSIELCLDSKDDDLESPEENGEGWRFDLLPADPPPSLFLLLVVPVLAVAFFLVVDLPLLDVPLLDMFDLLPVEERPLPGVRLPYAGDGVLRAATLAVARRRTALLLPPSLAVVFSLTDLADLADLADPVDLLLRRLLVDVLTDDLDVLTDGDLPMVDRLERTERVDEVDRSRVPRADPRVPALLGVEDLPLLSTLLVAVDARLFASLNSILNLVS
jgi:hypothetical protein